MDYHSVKPTWVFDLEEGKLLGKAHATCVSKAKIPYDCNRRAIGTPPTKAQIKFAVKLYKFRNERSRSPVHGVGFYAYILTTSAMYTVSNVSELLSSSRVRELLDWWQNGSKIMTPQKAEQITKLVQTELEGTNK